MPGARGPDGADTLYHTRFDPRRPEGAFVVIVLDGPQAGQRVRLDGSSPGRVLVGQSEACAVRLDDRTVSRRHAAFEVVDGALLVADLGSRNGTRINGVRIKEAIIDERAVIELGAVRLQVDRDPDPQPAPLSGRTSFGRVIGASTEMRRLYPLCERLAASSIPVVIEGETGTGKEALAEALHAEGPRRAGPFVVLDCTAVAPALIEAEIFGHERGAFTGADRARPGLFAQADGGTLLVDEIGDLPLSMQAKMLRAIDRSEVRPVGASQAIRFDVRIVAATRRDLDQEVQAGRFRDDLYHRLAVGRVELPPLRRRRGDVGVLARHFWAEQGGDPAQLSAELVARWEGESWPGNVRELRNTVSRYLALGELAQVVGRPTVTGDAPLDPSAMADLLALPLAEARARLIENFERAYVAGVLDRTGGNVTRAAEHAGVARRYFHLLKARTGGADD